MGSSLPPRATTLKAPSGSGRCSFNASTGGAEISRVLGLRALLRLPADVLSLVPVGAEFEGARSALCQSAAMLIVAAAAAPNEIPVSQMEGSCVSLI